MSQQNQEKTSFPNPSDQTSDSRAASRLRIVTYRKGMADATFYIQSKGKHAGRPLQSPITNCWAVYTDLDHLRGIAYSIYASGHLRTMLVGSVVPFLRVTEYRKILIRAASNADHYDPKHLRTLEFLNDQIDSFATKLELFKQFQTVLAFKINHELEIFTK